jgi:hypothetical protein
MTTAPSHKYVETSGVQVFDIIWPIKIEDQSRVWLVTLELWDAAATNMKANDITVRYSTLPANSTTPYHVMSI